MMKSMKENIVPTQVFDKLPDENKEGKLKRGIFRKEIKPVYTDQYANLIDSVKVSKGDK